MDKTSKQGPLHTLTDLMPNVRRMHIFAIVAGVLMSSPAAADVKQDVGYVGLVSDLGVAVPTGQGVAISQVEAPVQIEDPVLMELVDAWLPDPSNTELAGKTIIDVTGSSSGFFSGHATGVARRLFGLATSLAPGIDSVLAYEANAWIGADALRAGSVGQPLNVTGRLSNHSWIGDSEDSASAILRRVDWLIDTQEHIQVVGLSNGSPNPPLLSGAFNVIAVGVTEAEHGMGSAAVDTLYTAGRTRPHLVAPETTTSAATPTVSAALSLLIEVAHAQPELSTDPVTQSINTVSGGLIYNAERSEVLKAVIMAAATRRTSNTTAADISDYRLEGINQSDNGLDTRYGAGQLDVLQSYRILSAGEQNSAEDQPAMAGMMGSSGFDYDPDFGGAQGSNSQASYRLPVQSDTRELTVALVWNLEIDGGRRFFFDGTAYPLDLDLRLLDVTDDPLGVEIASSHAGPQYNSEHLWLALEAGREYLLRVVPGSSQGSFARDFAIAWLLRDPPPPDSDADGVADAFDNCTLSANPVQGDADDGRLRQCLRCGSQQ